MENGTVKNLTVKGSVSGREYIGGIVGQTEGTVTIEKCENKAELINNSASFSGIGGIIGYVWTGTANVKDCVNSGAISAQYNKDAVGGIVGFKAGSATVNMNTSKNAPGSKVNGAPGTDANLIGK